MDEMLVRTWQSESECEEGWVWGRVSVRKDEYEEGWLRGEKTEETEGERQKESEEGGKKG